MRRTDWLFVFAVATGVAVGATSVSAQPTERDHRDTKPEPPRRRPPPSADGPREAPPPPRAETYAARAGFVWVPGRWEWHAKWDWVAGHWERERAGKKWREGHWDRKDDKWSFTEGTWIDAAGEPPKPADNYPREAPPSPKSELQAAKAGFVWQSGKWEWRAGKWEWVGGHWERERAGKRWNPGRWDKQGDHYAYVEGTWLDAAGEPTNYPREAPPSLKPEPQAARAGFIWQSGKWEWRAGKWEWVGGHWERERAGKRWNPGRWDKQGDRYAYVEGDWVDASATPTSIPGGNPDEREHHRRDWKLDRPMVSSYWPVKGKIGSRIVIHGKNFPSDATVEWAGAPVKGLKIDPDRIVIAVPPGAKSGDIVVRAGRRELDVGTFEVADYDGAAEAKRLEDEARKRAEQQWAERQKQLAGDRAARAAAAEKRWRERVDSREQRRADRLREIRAKYEAAFLGSDDTQNELTLHAQRKAQLDRMREVAELSENSKLVVRIGIAQAKEDARHEARMTSLHGSFGRKP